MVWSREGRDRELKMVEGAEVQEGDQCEEREERGKKSMAGFRDAGNLERVESELSKVGDLQKCDHGFVLWW